MDPPARLRIWFPSGTHELGGPWRNRTAVIRDLQSRASPLGQRTLGKRIPDGFRFQTLFPLSKARHLDNKKPASAVPGGPLVGNLAFGCSRGFKPPDPTAKRRASRPFGARCTSASMSSRSGTRFGLRGKTKYWPFQSTIMAHPGQAVKPIQGFGGCRCMAGTPCEIWVSEVRE